MIFSLITMLLLATGSLEYTSIHDTLAMPVQTTQVTDAPRTKCFSISMPDGWTSKAELTFPSSGSGPWPTVILFHGSGPSDMDSTIRSNDGLLLTANFRTLAKQLPQSGIAVLRFNKRGVHSSTNIDWTQASKATTNQLISDAKTVLNAARNHLEINKDALFLYGWSQGAQVATHAAAQDGHISGLILHGGPTSGIPAIVSYQLNDVVMPALSKLAKKNNGTLSINELMSPVLDGPVHLWLYSMIHIFAPGSTLEHPKLNPLIDTNHDNQLNIETELRPIINQIIANPANLTPFLDSANEPKKQIDDVLQNEKIPTLVLNGLQDGFVPYTDAIKIYNAAPNYVTLHLYPNLGHALSPTSSIATDSVGPIASQPLNDIVTWLHSHYSIRKDRRDCNRNTRV